MSAFLVSPAHIDAIVTYACNHDMRFAIPADSGLTDGADELLHPAGDPEHADALGQILFEANAESLAARYGARDVSALEGFALSKSYAYRAHPGVIAGTLGPLDIAAAIACLDYQSCEHDGWQMSLAQWLALSIGAHAGSTAARLADAERGTWEIASNPGRPPEPDFAPPAFEPEELEPEELEGAAPTRGGLLARMAARLTGSPMPQPEPEVKAAKARKSAKAAPAAPEAATAPESPPEAPTGAPEGEPARKARRMARAPEIQPGGIESPAPVAKRKGKAPTPA